MDYSKKPGQKIELIGELEKKRKTNSKYYYTIL